MDHTQLRPFRFADVLATVQAAQPCVLVTVTDVQGSAPREPGTLMLVCADGFFGTIGGGHLEWRAMEIAQTMMNAPEAAGEARRQFVRIPLGPALGQCCGGVVRLSLERLDARDVKWIALADDAMRQRRSLRRIVSADPAVAVEASVGDAAAAGVQLDAGGFTQTVLPPDMSIVLCGAGHVGHAIVRALAHLPCRVTWVDERDAMFPFPTEVPPNVVIESTDTPEAVIDQAPAGSYFLVMTHNHALDLALCERIMRRTDFAYFGLIGSKTKRARFEHRMVEHGVDPARLPEMVCPIGVAGIVDKAPDIIAVSVVAQLLQVRELQQHALTSASSGAAVPYRVPTSV
ncbi:xanthine dehydrogenase accessory protein XdhC [Ralstonia pickettii]|uniref:xanthine dehydrogenase accessory protein XdhC n=1 Tax=Ralstonia pickettii TaxID=329 RepID=UPI000818C841|nr:xanthine dehydrogenase accessory protein XdhC [Ralstonia pickettii]OCS45791.1 xanthine dehydrogenase accessory protein XdhC [Ralstonia pickettii]